MPAEAALAIVVRGTDWSETSRITTLFTREFGKVRALAKGGRRLKSSFEIAFDLLTVCNIMVIRKGHGGLDLLTEARMAEQFPHLRTDLAALYAGYYIAELLSDGTADYDPHPALFDAAVETLRRLNATHFTDVKDSASSTPVPSPLCGGGLGLGEGSGVGTSLSLPNPIPSAVAAFELVWLRELGYSPRLDGCAGCGIVLDEAARVLFSPTAGGILCPTCAMSTADRRPLSAEGLKALRRLTTGDDVSLSTAERIELRPLLGQTVSYVLGRRPKLLAYVDGSGLAAGNRTGAAL